jgi:hypothetical protein
VTTSRNSLSKYGDFWFCFLFFGLQNMSIFPLKKSFTRDFFFGCKILPKRKNLLWTMSFIFLATSTVLIVLVMKVVFFYKFRVVARSYFDWPITKKLLENWTCPKNRSKVLWYDLGPEQNSSLLFCLLALQETRERLEVVFSPFSGYR